MASNVAASVRQRLLNRTRETGEDYQVVLTRFALERLLYRLTQLPEGERFVLKGAFTFLVWEGEEHRMTRDLDLLGRGAPEPERLRGVFERVCQVKAPEDGVAYDPKAFALRPFVSRQSTTGCV